MFYYTEERRTFINHRGVERGDPTIAQWFQGMGAEHGGLSGDGTGKATHRLWQSDTDLSPLPDGVQEITEATYDAADVTRESTKPVRPPPPEPDSPPLTSEERVALRALLP